MILLGRLLINRSSPHLWTQSFRSCWSREKNLAIKFLVSNNISRRSLNVEKQEHVWTIPNILTFARIGSSPILGVLIINEYSSMAVSLFLLSGLTDLLDGWIARRYPSQASALGSFLDPFADKILVGIVVISLAYVQLIPLWLLALILGRDVAIMCAAAYLRVKSVQPPRTLKKILNMKNATVQLYPTFVSKVSRIVLFRLKYL